MPQFGASGQHPALVAGKKANAAVAQEFRAIKDSEVRVSVSRDSHGQSRRLETGTGGALVDRTARSIKEQRAELRKDQADQYAREAAAREKAAARMRAELPAKRLAAYQRLGMFAEAKGVGRPNRGRGGDRELNMSSTRRTSKPGAIRQERFASSSSLPKGLLGNLIAKRCAALRDTGERNLIHFLHELSLRDGFTLHRTCNLFPAWPWPSTATAPAERAFERVARELVEMFPDRIEARHVEKFRKLFPRFLVKLCLDPAAELSTATMPTFAGIVDALHAYKRRIEAAGAGRLAPTAATRSIHGMLDYALTVRGITLALGTHRIGKSFSAQSWAQMHLGEARYVQLSSAPDDGAFFRDIAPLARRGVRCADEDRRASRARGGSPTCPTPAAHPG